MSIFYLVAGAIAVMLGGLWFLQGVGAVHIEPILCVADCEPLEGPSAPWAILGLVVATAGVLAVVRAVRRRRRPPEDPE